MRLFSIELTEDQCFLISEALRLRCRLLGQTNPDYFPSSNIVDVVDELLASPSKEVVNNPVGFLSTGGGW
jgi:hypothetical protein